MNNSEFEAPSLTWAVLSVVGGVATGIGLIWGLEWFGSRLTPKPQSLSAVVTIVALDPVEAVQSKCQPE